MIEIKSDVDSTSLESMTIGRIRKDARCTSKACFFSGNRFTDRPINRVLSVGPAPRLRIYFRHDTVVCDANRSVGTSSKCRGSQFQTGNYLVTLLSRSIMKIVPTNNVSNPAQNCASDQHFCEHQTVFFKGRCAITRSLNECRYTQRQR